MRRLLVTILSIALLAGACSDPADEEVARVGDTVITVGDVAALFSTDALPIDSGFRLAAFRLVALDILEGAYVAEFGPVDEAAAEAEYRGFLDEIASEGLTVADAYGIADATEEMVRFDARLTVIRDGLVDSLARAPEYVDGLLTELAERPEVLTTVCSRHVLVSTEEEAADVLARLRGGEDLAAVALEVSLDSSPAGDLGCTAPSRFVAPFAEATMAAPIGEYYGPVETEFGFHVIVVDERTTPTAEELTADPAIYLAPEVVTALWTDWFNARLAAADVTVNPRFGVWDPATLRIVAPPEG